MRSAPRSVLRLFLALVAAGAASSPAQVLGPEIPVNTYTSHSQMQPAVAADAGGNFVIAWESTLQDGTSCGYRYATCVGVVARRFAASGEPLTGEILVNTYTTGKQSRAGVAADAEGNFVVVWESYPADYAPHWVAGRRFDTAGQPLEDEFQISETGNAGQPAVAGDPAGNFVVVWQRRDGTDLWGISGRRYGVNGQPLGTEFPVRALTTYPQSRADVTLSADGSFVITWTDGGLPGVVGQRFDPNGDPLGDPFEVDAWTESALAERSPGQFVVAGADYWVWELGVWGRSFDAGGATGPSFEVTPGSTFNYKTRPDVAVDDAGGFLVVWQVWSLADPFWGVRARRFGADDAPLGPEFRVNTYSSGDQGSPAVAATGTGSYVVAWDSEQDGSYRGVYARLVSYVLFADGFETGDVCEWSGTVGGGCP